MKTQQSLMMFTTIYYLTIYLTLLRQFNWSTQTHTLNVVKKTGSKDLQSYKQHLFLYNKWFICISLYKNYIILKAGHLNTQSKQVDWITNQWNNINNDV